MKLSAILAPLIVANVPGEVILQTVRAFEQQEESALEKRREADRKRQQAYRDRNVTSRDVTVTERDRHLVRGSARVEDNLLPIEDSGQKDKKDRSPSAPTPRQALLEVLDDEHAAAVVEHRQRIKKPLTHHAAKLLAGKLSRCPDANAAADEMIANGWQRVEPEWLQPRQGLRVVNGHGPPPERSLTEALMERARARS